MSKQNLYNNINNLTKKHRQKKETALLAKFPDIPFYIDLP